jgi:hypothetical protein
VRTSDEENLPLDGPSQFQLETSACAPVALSYKGHTGSEAVEDIRTALTRETGKILDREQTILRERNWGP